MHIKYDIKVSSTDAKSQKMTKNSLEREKNIADQDPASKSDPKVWLK